MRVGKTLWKTAGGAAQTGGILLSGVKGGVVEEDVSWRKVAWSSRWRGRHRTTGAAGGAAPRGPIGQQLLAAGLRRAAWRRLPVTEASPPRGGSRQCQWGGGRGDGPRQSTGRAEGVCAVGADATRRASRSRASGTCELIVLAARQLANAVLSLAPQSRQQLEDGGSGSCRRAQSRQSSTGGYVWETKRQPELLRQRSVRPDSLLLQRCPGGSTAPRPCARGAPTLPKPPVGARRFPPRRRLPHANPSGQPAFSGPGRPACADASDSAPGGRSTIHPSVHPSSRKRITTNIIREFAWCLYDSLRTLRRRCCCGVMLRRPQTSSSSSRLVQPSFSKTRPIPDQARLPCRLPSNSSDALHQACDIATAAQVRRPYLDSRRGPNPRPRFHKPLVPHFAVVCLPPHAHLELRVRRESNRFLGTVLA